MARSARRAADRATRTDRVTCHAVLHFPQGHGRRHFNVSCFSLHQRRLGFDKVDTIVENFARLMLTRKCQRDRLSQ